MAQDAKQPKRAWSPLRFSLRTLLTLVLAVSAFFAGRSPMVHRVRQLEQERDEFKKLAEQEREQ